MLHGVNSRRGGSLVCPRKVCSPDRVELSKFMRGGGNCQNRQVLQASQLQKGAWAGGLSIFRSSFFNSYNPGRNDHGNQ